MKSKEILSEKDRLSVLEVNQLEGFTESRDINRNKDELLLKYHNALTAAEKELLSSKIIEKPINFMRKYDIDYKEY